MWPFNRRPAPHMATEIKSLAEPSSELLALFGSVATASGVTVSAETPLRVPAVAMAVRTISEAAAGLDMRVVSIAEDGTETVDRSHPVTTFIAGDVNAWTSRAELVRDLVAGALVRDGGAAAWINRTSAGLIAEIVNYRPGVLQIDLTAETGEPVYRIGGAVISPQNVLHIRGPFDRSPVTLAREAIALASVMEQHAARLFGNGARPSGVIEAPKTLGDDGLKRMKAGWQAAHGGAENSGRTAILWDGATFRPLTFSSVDAQFQELRLFQIQEIARAFNMPASMLGDLSRATWSNSAEMQRQFLLLCLEPWLKVIEAAFTRALFLPDERGRYAIRIDRDDFSNVDLAVRATAINSLVASRVLNPNEGRSWLGGLAPYDGGDEFANPNTGASQPGAAPTNPADGG